MPTAINTALQIADIRAYSNLSRANNDAAQNASDINNVAAHFSSMLIDIMVDSMRDTLTNREANAQNGLQYEFFNDLLFQQYSEVIANSNALGINQLISDSLSR